LLKKINKELNITIVLITHEMNVVKEICDRMAIMQDGKVIEEGQVYDIFSNPVQPLTKEFISSVVSYDIPEAVMSNLAGTLIKITFKGEVAMEGVISDTMQKYKVKGNFLHGSIEYIQERALGIFLMELQGERQEVKQAIAYILKQNAQVEVIRQHV